MLDRIRPFHVLARWAGIVALLLILPATYAAGLNDTGITTCSNETENGLPCPVAGFPGQDAEFGTNGFDFTKLDAAGNDLPTTATNHSCVRDNVTGLIWEVKTNDGGLRDQNKTYTFSQTTDYVKNVNATNLCGFKDWRMPNLKELFGIADHSQYSPAIDTDYFLNTPSEGFWSSSFDADGSGDVRYVEFITGYITFDGRGDSHHVRLVHGESSVNSFVNNNDGTITQTNTGLMWAKCSEGQTGSSCTGTAAVMDWSQALTAANNSNLGGYNDWRLPNVKELQTLIDQSNYNPAIDTSYFPNTPSSWFWSGSPVAYYPELAWFVYFDYGGASYYYRDYYGHVRLVRGGQSFDPFDLFQLKITKSGTGSGGVSSKPAGIDCGSSCSGDFESDSSVVLTAAPDANSTFGGWSDGGCSGSGSCTVKMSEAQTVTATFTAKPVTYSLSVSKVGTGTVSSDPAGINCGSDCVASFDKGKVVTLTATPASGYSFGGWSGACSNTSGTCSVSMAAGKAVTATFIVAAPVTYKLTVTKTGSGAVSSDPAGINCGSSCSANFDSDSAVILTAESASGATFSGWSGCTAFATNPLQCQVDMNKAKTVSATFAAVPTPPVTYKLTVSKTGNGAVSSAPAGINCGSDCAENFASGTVVTLTAAPAADSTFVSWSGCTALATNALHCTVTMSKASTVSATFASIPPPTSGGTLTVTTTGNGNVSSDPEGISCGTGTNCTVDFGSGTTVILSATPVEGETFLRWNGCTAAANNPNQCRVTLTDNLSVRATFSTKTTPLADLRVMGIVIEPKLILANQTFTVTITIKNNGNSKTNSSTLELWANEPNTQTCGATGDEWAKIDQLAAGAKTTIPIKIKAPNSSGKKRLRIFLDSRCAVKELEDRNNQSGKWYTVK
jgi:hypothetical protein